MHDVCAMFFAVARNCPGVIAQSRSEMAQSQAGQRWHHSANCEEPKREANAALIL
jgi:hypothetical protein